MNDGNGRFEAFCNVAGVSCAVEEIGCFCCVGGENGAIVGYAFDRCADAVGSGAGVKEGDGCLGFCVDDVGDLRIAGVCGDRLKAGWCNRY